MSSTIDWFKFSILGTVCIVLSILCSISIGYVTNNNNVYKNMNNTYNTQLNDIKQKLAIKNSYILTKCWISNYTIYEHDTYDSNDSNNPYYELHIEYVYITLNLEPLYFNKTVNITSLPTKYLQKQDGTRCWYYYSKTNKTNTIPFFKPYYISVNNILFNDDKVILYNKTILGTLIIFAIIINSLLCVLNYVFFSEVVKYCKNKNKDKDTNNDTKMNKDTNIYVDNNSQFRSDLQVPFL